MAASQAKLTFVSHTNNTVNSSQVSEPNTLVGASLSKITRNQLVQARMRSFERPTAAATGEESFSSSVFPSRLTVYTPGEEVIM